MDQSITRDIARAFTRPLIKGSSESAPPPWTPQDLFTGGVTGAWYQISDLTTLYEERTGGGSTQSSVNGVVGTIRDKSGLGNHLVAPSDAARGILRQSGSEYYIELDNTDDTYSTSASFTWAAPTFCGLTAQRAATTNNVLQHGFYGAATRYVGFGASAGDIRGAQRNATDGLSVLSIVGSEYPVNTTKVLQLVGANNSLSFQINNASPSSNTTTFNYANFTSTTSIFIDRASVNGGRLYGGIFCMDKTMSTDDLNKARTWLGALGGLTL